MDSYRGHFSDQAGGYDPLDVDDDAFVSDREEMAAEPPPAPVGQDERRMQVRAYNLWASLLGSRAFPSVGDLVPDSMPELAQYAVMLHFDNGIENPRIDWVGEKLAEECGAGEAIVRLSDVPGRSLLSRITDHYLQIIANQAPIGFEAEFVNQRGRTIVYRGILLPFSEDGTTIEHILGVINWKELADQATTDALLAEVDRALGVSVPEVSAPAVAAPQNPVTDWVEPVAELDDALMDDDTEVLDLGEFADVPFPDVLLPDAPLPGTGLADVAAGDEAGFAERADEAAEPSDLAGWLASARALAEAAHTADDRSRAALYAAIGRAWDFALAASDAPEEFAALVAAAGLAVQARAPLIPVVKLVFGVDYDKTRLTEFATALAHAQRLGFACGQLAGYLAEVPGGLKGVVQEERRLRRDAAGDRPAARSGPREAIARKLRRIVPRPLEAFAGGDSEFAVLLARRLESGEIVLLGEATGDVGLVERTARKLAG